MKINLSNNELTLKRLWARIIGELETYISWVDDWGTIIRNTAILTSRNIVPIVGLEMHVR